MGDVFIKTEDLTKVYKTGAAEVRALDRVSLSFEKGKIYAVLGPSGSGKSTLFNLIGGIDRPDGGKIWVDGEEISSYSPEKLTRYRREKVGFVFQFYNLINTLTVYENVQAAADLSASPADIKTVLELVGMLEHKDKYPLELSGGEAQRVAIARAVIKRPPLILCDEPTGALDYQNAKKVLELLEKVNKETGATVMIITHNQAIARMCHGVVTLRSGQVTGFSENPAPVAAREVEW